MIDKSIAVNDPIKIMWSDNASTLSRCCLSLMQQHEEQLWPTHSGNNYNYGSSSNPTLGSSSYAAPTLKFTISDSDIMELEPPDLMKNQHH
jgi:hypothetical protein